MTPKTSDPTTPNTSNEPDEAATPVRSSRSALPPAVRDRVGRVFRYRYRNTGGHEYEEDGRRRRPDVLRLTELEAEELRSTGRVYVRLVAGYYDAVDSAELTAIDRRRRR